MAQGLLGAPHSRGMTLWLWRPFHRRANIPLALIRMRNSMPAAAKKKALKTFHATMHVTRLEEWCVEAATAEEARALLASGGGHRCHLGDRVHAEVDAILDEA